MMPRAPVGPRPAGQRHLTGMMETMTAKLSVLWGRDHTELREAAVEAAGPGVAIGLTRGRFPKGYAHVEPNEDVVAAAVGSRATLLVVADGHHGCAAAEVAVETVLDRLGADPPPEGLAPEAWIALFAAAAEAVGWRPGGGDLEGRPEQDSRTTMTVAIAADGRVHWASLGDSVAYTITGIRAGGRAGGRARALNRPRHRFLGARTTAADLRRDLDTGTKTLRRGGWVALATDGLTEFVRPTEDALARAVVLPGGPTDAVGHLLDLAGRAGAGDNVAVAIAELP
jgi:serine/threonine protein phosphatase PrpC